MYVVTRVRAHDRSAATRGRPTPTTCWSNPCAPPKGPRQKVVCSLGDLSPRPRAQWLELARKVEAALGGQPELLAADDAEVAKVVERVRRGRPRRQRSARLPI